jgi:hypothetical protein
MRKPEKQTTALKLVLALRAYCPRVKTMEPTAFAMSRAAEQRRKRPMIGRGNYGRNLMTHFDTRNQAKRLGKKILGAFGGAEMQIIGFDETADWRK